MSDIGCNNFNRFILNILFFISVNSGVPHTIYKGNQKKYTKECIIIFDKVTGDVTLERLNNHIQVKKTR